MVHEGISAEDAERLWRWPMERELQGLEGLKEMRSTASEGHASVLLEFEAGTDIDLALADVREKVDIAKVELPEDTEEPLSRSQPLLFPVLVVAGAVPERTLLTSRATSRTGSRPSPTCSRSTSRASARRWSRS